MQAYANRYENLPEGEEDIRKSGLQKVLTRRLSSNEQDPGIPNMFLHRAWVFLLYQSPTPSPPPAWIMCSGLQVAQGLAPDAASQLPSTCALHLLTTNPLRMAEKDLPLPLTHDCNLHPKLGLSPQRRG